MGMVSFKMTWQTSSLSQILVYDRFYEAIHRGCYMSTRVLLIPLNELRKRDKMRDFS